MSLPDEELRAVRSTWEFLLELGNSYGGYKRVPLHVRLYARQLAKHFPLGGEMRNLITESEDKDTALVKLAESLEEETGIKGTAKEALRELGFISLSFKVRS